MRTFNPARDCNTPLLHQSWAPDYSDILEQCRQGRPLSLSESLGTVVEFEDRLIAHKIRTHVKAKTDRAARERFAVGLRAEAEERRAAAIERERNQRERVEASNAAAKPSDRRLERLDGISSRYHQGLSFVEIASAMDLKEEDVRTIIGDLLASGRMLPRAVT